MESTSAACPGLAEIEDRRFSFTDEMKRSGTIGRRSAVTHT